MDDSALVKALLKRQQEILSLCSRYVQNEYQSDQARRVANKVIEIIRRPITRGAESEE